MDRLQYAESIATGKNEALDASLPKRGFQLPRLPGHPYSRARGAQFLGGCARFARVNLIRRTQAGELGGRPSERCDHLTTFAEAGIGQSFDAAGLKQVAGEIRTRTEIGNHPETGKKYLGPCSGARTTRLGGMAQGFKRLGEPN